MRTEKEYCISEFAQDFLRSALIGQAFLLYYYNFFVAYFSLLILKCYTEFQLNVYPGTGIKVCGGGG